MNRVRAAAVGPDPDRLPSVARTRVNEKGEVELVVRPSTPRRGPFRSRQPRTKDEIRRLMKDYGLS